MGLKASIERPWMKHYIPGRTEDIDIECSMYEMIRRNNLGHESECALHYYGRDISYGEFHRKIDEYAAAFSELGVKKGDYVSLLTVVIPEAIVSIYALNKIGAVCNMIDVRIDGEHILEYIKKAASKILIAVDIDMAIGKVAGKLEDAGVENVILHNPKDSLPALKKLFMRGKMYSSENPVGNGRVRVLKNSEFEALGKDKDVPACSFEKNFPAAVVRTGGTTGKSKGVVVTNECMNGIWRNIKAFPLREEGTLLNFLPIAVSYGIACGIHIPLCYSVKSVLVPKFVPDDFAELIMKYKPNHVVGVPVFYEKLMNSRKAQKADLSFIWNMIAGGDSANINFEKNLREFSKERGVPYPLAQGYGMSEVTSVCSVGLMDIHKDGSAGIPCYDNIISAFKPGTTEELGIGEIGEICITGTTVMKGYLNEPEETENVMWKHPDGRMWIHSGDLGYIDEDGFLFIRGRLKRTIVRFDGHKSYPVQIEEAVAKHDDIQNCSVIPVKDREHEQGELPLVVAKVVPEFSGDESKLKREIFDICGKYVEERSQPVDVVLVCKLPLTRSGKIDVKELLGIYGEYDYLKK